MQILPLTPSVPHERFNTVLNGTPYTFEVRWNASANGRRGAWFLDAFEADLTPIFRGAKIVLGTYIGRWKNHPLTRDGALVAIDTTRAGRDAGLDDLGTRVQVWYFTSTEIVFGLREARERAER